jgi:integrase
LKRLSFFQDRPEALVFPSPRRPDTPFHFEKHFRQALADARIEHAVFHTLRHTHAAWLAAQGASLLAIAELLNHKSLVMVRAMRIWRSRRALNWSTKSSRKPRAEEPVSPP